MLQRQEWFRLFRIGFWTATVAISAACGGGGGGGSEGAAQGETPVLHEPETSVADPKEFDSVAYQGIVDFVRQPDGRHQSVVRVENRNADTVAVALALEGLLFTDRDDVLEAIERLAPEYAGEPNYRKAWRFLTTRTYHSTPFSPFAEQHDPLLYLNSIGYGLCDDASAVLATVWRWQGYESRIWALEGHVVPEVKVDGRWLMFDADYALTYFDGSSRIASVEQLATSPGLITNPVSPLWPTTYSGYSAYVASIYASRADNSAHDFRSAAEHPLVIALPARSALTFPVDFDDDVLSYVGDTIPLVGAGKIELAPRSVVDLRLPFVVLDVRGSGTVAIDSIVYAIGSTEARRRIRGHEVTGEREGQAVTRLSLRVGAQPVSVFFSINPFATDGGRDAPITLLQRSTDAAVYVAVSAGDGNDSASVRSDVLIDVLKSDLGSPVSLRGTLISL